MTDCVPSWRLDGSSSHLNLVLSSHSNSNNSFVTDAPEMDYEVAELTWENGQVVMHGLGPPRVPNKPLSTPSPTKYTWDNKPHVGGTLESIVNQATTGIPHHDHQKSPVDGGSEDRGDDFVSWFDDCLPGTQTTTAIDTVAVDALVPTSSTNTPNSHQQVPPSIHVSGIPSKRIVSCSTCVASCSGDRGFARVRTGSAHEEISKDFEITESFGNGEVKNLIRSTVYEGHKNMADQTVSRRDTSQTEERDLGAERRTATSMGSPENTSKYCKSKTVDANDFISHSRAQESRDNEDEDEKKGSKISSFSTKRSRAAATHNQSEQKRRDKINQRMKTLQKLVPTSSKTDKASMLDEVIEYLKQLQAQVNAMSRMIHVNMPPPMMLPNMALQQQEQFHMSMMGMVRPIDVNALSRPNITTMPSILHATAPSNFNMSPIASHGASPADPLASFLPAGQSQRMTMDAYSRMAALYQQYLQFNANLGFKN